MTDLTFRYATPADAPALVALIERAYRSEEAAGSWASEADLLKGPRTSLAEVEGLIADDASRILVAARDHIILGSCLIQKASDQAAYFGLFAIDPADNGTGLGKQVLAQAEAAARSLWGSHTMMLTVINRRTALIEWYERRSYRLTGERRPFPFSETSGETTRDFDLVEMTKALT